MGKVLVIGGADFSEQSLALVTNQSIDMVGRDILIGCFSGVKTGKGGVWCPSGDTANIDAISALGMNTSTSQAWSECFRFTKDEIAIPNGAVAIGGVFTVLLDSNHRSYNMGPLLQYDANGAVVGESFNHTVNFNTINGVEIVKEISGLFGNGNFSVALVNGVIRLNSSAKTIRACWTLPYKANTSVNIQHSIVSIGVTYPRLSWIFES